MWAEGDGISVANPKHGQTSYGAAALGARAGLRLSRNFLIRIGGFGLVPTRRPRLYLDGLGTVLQPSAVDARLETSVDFELP